MNKLHYIILFPIILIGCNDSKEIKEIVVHLKTEKAVKVEDSVEYSYSNKRQSSFHILKDSIEFGLYNYVRQYTKTESIYTVFRIYHPDSIRNKMSYHIAEITKISKLAIGAEGGNSEIKVIVRPFDNPTEIDFTLNEKCDEIKFDPDFYRVIENGCCSFEGWIKLYNYDRELIAEGEPAMINEKYPEW